MLTTAGCRARQSRFRERLAALHIDAAALSDYRDIYYLTGILLPDKLPALMLFDALGSGRTLLVAPDERLTESVVAVVDECLTYEWSHFGTMNPNPVGLMNAVVAARLKGAQTMRRLGWQAESLPRLCANTLDCALQPDEWVDIDATLAEMQRRKDPDEVEMMARAAQVNLAGYTAAQAAIAPGVNELAVLAAGQRGAMLKAGERVYHDGDYRCGQFNGPARDRRIEAGEIYIIDAQTCYRGYWSDLSRAYIVGGEPTALQQSLFDHIAAIQESVADLLKPGGDGRDVWRELDRRIRAHPALAETGLTHHGGHGIGLRLHEMPDINCDRGGILEVGNVLSIEPGGYIDEARYGVRIENTYLITESGAVNLCEYPVNFIAVK